MLESRRSGTVLASREDVPPALMVLPRGIPVRRHSRLVLLTLGLAAGTAACAGSNPAGPSAPTMGATIAGVIVSEGGTASKHVGGSGGSLTVPGLVVSVAGTNISAVVDNADQFTLRSVPSGTAVLQFVAPTLNASATLTDLQNSETVNIGVVISGGTVMVDSQHREHGREVQLEGRIEALPPTTSPLTFIAAGRHVTTNATTLFYFRGDETATFADLEIGMRVHVKGTRNGESLVASLVRIQNPRVDLPVQIHGIVEEFSGTPAAFEFRVGDRLIKGDADTAFQGGSRFSDLANGRRVEVKGQLRDGYVYALRIKVNP